MKAQLILLGLISCAFETSPLRHGVFNQPVQVPLNVYVHIPFCRRRCHYCNFPIQIVGKHKLTDATETYTHLINKEIVKTSIHYNFKSRIEELGGLKTLYFGGGTPSLMEPLFLKQIISTITDQFGKLSSECEVTMEMVS
jgi:coproporphyrinogen III oxidase-like Fe-S oxidoreductase